MVRAALRKERSNRPTDLTYNISQGRLHGRIKGRSFDTYAAVSVGRSGTTTPGATDYERANNPKHITFIRNTG